jgi:hypothetical protein
MAKATNQTSRDGSGNRHHRWRHATTALALARGFLLPNEKVEQLAANNLTTPQDAIASLLQRLVLPALVSSWLKLKALIA